MANMPVQVRVALLATDRHQVGPFRLCHRLDRERDATYDRHHSEELSLGLVAHHVVDVGFRRDNDVAGHCSIAAEESDVGIVLVDRLVVVVGLTGEPQTKQVAFPRNS